MGLFSSEKVQRVVEQCEQVIAAKDDAWSLDRPSAVWLYELALLRRAKLIVEIGASYGHSGLFLADAALRNRGQFFTAEKESRKVQIVKQFLVQAGLDANSTVLEGAAPDVLSGVPNGIDFLFIDAAKPEQDSYLDALWNKLSDRAVIVTDNVTTHADDMAGFLRRLRDDPRMISTLNPIGHGMECTLRMQ